MFRNGTWRVFLAGALCGTIFMAVAWAASVWWKPRPERSAGDDAIYDMCLADSGNTVACDAMMRTLDRLRTKEAALKEEAARLLAAGFSKREVVEWGLKRGFVATQMIDAVGISMKEFKEDKY